MSDRKYDPQTIADDWWEGRIDRIEYVENMTLAEHRELRAELAKDIRSAESRLNRLNWMRDELRERALKSIGADK